jgi:hypothetical protein
MLALYPKKEVLWAVQLSLGLGHALNVPVLTPSE